MIQSVSAPRTPSVPTASRATSSPSRFALSLAIAPGGDPGAGSAGSVVDAAGQDDPGGQDTADDGTELPTGNVAIDPRLLWLPVATPMPPVATPIPVPLAAKDGLATSPADSAAPDRAAATAPVTMLTGTVPKIAAVAPTAPSPIDTLPARPNAAVPLSASVSTTLVDAAPLFGAQVPTSATAPSSDAPMLAPMAMAAEIPTPTPVAASAAAPAAIPVPLAQEPQTASAAAAAGGPLPIALPDPGRPATATPALQAFAGAMRAGWKQDARTGTRDDSDPVATATAATLAPLDTVRHAVAATGAAQEQTLDTRREHWPAAMIDHIESLRDAADATSSRIRVVPDALGTIDLSVKRDGDTLHVRFDAEQAATRTLLADAQPRLAEIAQSRGLRLGDTNVGNGGSGGAEQHPRAPVRATPTNPITPATAITTVAATDDTRIA